MCVCAFSYLLRRQKPVVRKKNFNLFEVIFGKNKEYAELGITEQEDGTFMYSRSEID